MSSDSDSIYWKSSNGENVYMQLKDDGAIIITTDHGSTKTLYSLRELELLFAHRPYRTVYILGRMSELILSEFVSKIAFVNAIVLYVQYELTSEILDRNFPNVRTLKTESRIPWFIGVKDKSRFEELSYQPSTHFAGETLDLRSFDRLKYYEVLDFEGQKCTVKMSHTTTCGVISTKPELRFICDVEDNILMLENVD